MCDSDCGALGQLPWLTVTRKLKMVADLGIVGSHIARVLGGGDKGHQKCQKDHCYFHFLINMANDQTTKHKIKYNL